MTDRLYDQVPSLRESIGKALPARRKVDDYAIIPVHPWQCFNTIAPTFSDFESGSVIPISDCALPVTPLLSFRTVVPYSEQTTRQHPTHIKLSTNVRLTNIVRTLPPESVYNGPEVSRILLDVEFEETFERFGIQPELAGACYYPHSELKSNYNPRAKQVSALVRQNPYEHHLVNENAQPITVASLISASPVSDQPIVCELIDEFQSRETSTSGKETTREFFEAYCRAVIPGPLTFLCKYGIALEPHPQNTCVVFRGGRAIAAIARDFAGIRVDPGRLSEAGYELKTHPGSMILTSDMNPLYNKLYYALFQNHLTELIVVLTQHTELNANTCWGIVRDQCLEALTSLRADQSVPAEWIDRDEARLFANEMPHKALTVMRLRGEVFDYIMQPVPNPL